MRGTFKSKFKRVMNFGFVFRSMAPECGILDGRRCQGWWEEDREVMDARHPQKAPKFQGWETQHVSRTSIFYFKTSRLSILPLVFYL